MARDRVFSAREVEGLIAVGDLLIIADNNVLRLNAWQHKHPGGNLVIQHMVGRDATDELSIFHATEVLATMRRFRIGRIEGQWVNFTPPIQGGVFRRECPEKEQDVKDAWKDNILDQKTTASAHCYAAGRLTGRLDTCKQEKAELACPEKKESEALPQPEVYISEAIQQDINVSLENYPSLEAETQRDITLKFQALHQKIQDEGFYNCRFRQYAPELARYTALFSVFLFCLRQEWYAVSACFLGLFWHQIMFTAHDAGHLGITHNFAIDTMIGIFIADFCCGLSIGWWKSSHNVHHLITNDPVHDPDIQNVPLFSTSPVFFTSIRSSYYNGFCFYWDKFADYAVQYQKYTYYPVMAVARFNLYFLSWAHLASGRSTLGNRSWTRPAEVFGIACYMFVYFYLLLYCTIPTWTSRAIFLVISHLITMPLHVQITLSHWGTSTADLGAAESFAQRQLRTTTDVACPDWLDFVHGGLQFQAIHHLFPRVPRHNLRRLSALVKDFCTETKIEYLSLGFLDANKGVLGRLQQIADQAKVMAACQAHMAATGESGLH